VGKLCEDEVGIKTAEALKIYYPRITHISEQFNK